MKRIAYMVFRLFWRVPGWLIRIFSMASSEKYSMEEKYTLIHNILGRAIKVGNVTVQIEGQDKVPTEGGCLITPNHQGMFDAVIMIHSNEKPISFVMKQELMKVPVLKQVLQMIGALAIDRNDVRQGMKVILQVAEELKEGKTYVIFPEGTRSRRGNLVGEFKGGSYKAAMKAKVPIVPVALVDSFKPFDIPSIKPVTVQMYYLDPIPYEEYGSMKTTEIAKMIQTRIQEEIMKHDPELVLPKEDGEENTSGQAVV